MKRYGILIFLFLLIPALAFANPAFGLLGSSKKSAPKTTYYVGFNNNHTTTMVTTAPADSWDVVDQGVYLDPTLPAGATVKAVHVYYADTPAGNIEVVVAARTDATTAGIVYANAQGITPIANTWSRHPIAATAAGKVLFSSSEQVYVGTAWDGSNVIGRESSGGTDFYKESAYGDDPLGALGTSSRQYAIILEYTTDD